MVEKNKAIKDMLNEIKAYREVGRVPLFILGAGISASKVPLMQEIFLKLEKFLREKESNEQFRKLADDAKRLAYDRLYQSRAVASKFFGTLLNRQEYQEVWDRFAEDFLMGRLRNSEPLWQLTPTEFHKYIAKEVARESFPAICISLNYDGFTAKAIRDEVRVLNSINETQVELDPLYPCRILTTAEEIESFYSRNVITSEFYPLIKLKGDIFNAVCENEGCRFFDKRTPIYEITYPSIEIEPLKEISKEAEENKRLPLFTSETTKDNEYEKVIKCRGCLKKRKIEIDFPGYRIKEKEVEKVIKELYRYVASRLSCIIVCGVSGKWDPELINFLQICTKKIEINIYCLDSAEQPSMALDLKGILKGKFKHIKLDFTTISLEELLG